MNFKKLLVVNLVLFSSFFFLPQLVVADGVTPPGGVGPTTPFRITLLNPLKSPDLNALLTDVINIILFVGMPVIALYIMYVGFQYVMAQGKPAEIANANKNLKWVLIGSAIVLGAFTISQIIQGTVNAIKG